MDTLSAARAFVGGEGLWSKAQKDAVISLQSYGATRDEKDYNAFLENLKLPDGDHQARLELLRPEPDFEKAKLGFLKGGIHEDDIPPVIRLLRRFYWISYLSRAIEVWTRGDELLSELKSAGIAYKQALVAGDQARASALGTQLKTINMELTSLESEFSAALGAGSRWLEYVLLSLLTLAVLSVESLGLSMTFLTSRKISRDLNHLRDSARRIGLGDFSQVVLTDAVRSRDEIGQLAEAIDSMRLLLRDSYGQLERRVDARTQELNAAVQSRDEFLSIASHELRTPLTALKLQLQLMLRLVQQAPGEGEGARKRVEDLAVQALGQSKRLTSLLDELLDLTRLRVGKLELKKERCDLAAIACEAVNQLGEEAARVGSLVTVETPRPVPGYYDSLRIMQVLTNLVSNAIKYGDGKPIRVSAKQEPEGRAVVSVKDHGPGIAPEHQEKIFERFERGSADRKIAGLGLGLYITKQIVEAHGGTIQVRSLPGAGSEFVIELPIG
jgi:signal transduction histidine kinase